MNDYPKRAGRPGLSLIEVLVAVAIVGVLTTLASVLLSQARGRSQSVACLANLRSHAMALHLWSQDNEGLFPTNKVHGELFPYLESGVAKNNPKVRLCPTQTEQISRRPDGWRSYAFNQYLTSAYDGDVYSWQKVRYLREVHDPSRVLLFTDGPVDRIDVATGAPLFRSLVRVGNDFAFPHDNGLNVVYVGGNAAQIPRSEFMSEDNQDITLQGNFWGVPVN